MSRLLQQRSAAVGDAPAQIRGRSTRPQKVAGIPLLMRLPDLSAQASSKIPTELDEDESPATEAAAPSPPTPRTKSSEPTASAREPKSPRWKFTIWQPLIGLALIVLFIGSWVVLSGPGNDQSPDPSDQEEPIDDLVITHGVATPVDELQTPAPSPTAPPPSGLPENASVSAAQQPPQVTVPPTEPIAPEASPAPPDLGSQPKWSPSQPPGADDLNIEPPDQALPDSRSAFTPPPAQGTAPRYPRTDPSTYIFPESRSGAGIARRPGQRYPSTNAPPPTQPR